MEIIEEKKYQITTDKNNKLDLVLRNYSNEELSITLFNNNEYPSKKYELKCNLEEFQKNRFFKIFINVEEIMKELENKLDGKSNFIEDSNSIIIEIQIGLKVINEVLLVIEEEEKNKDEKIEELEKYVKELKDELKDKENKLKDAENKINLREKKEKEEKEEIEKFIKKLKDELKDKENKLKGEENKINLNEEKEKEPEINSKIK